MSSPLWAAAWSAEEGAQRAIAAFEAAYGYAPDGVWSAPGRVNVIGEHTDYNDGLCLPIALPHRTFVAFATAARAGQAFADETRIRLFASQIADGGMVSADVTELCPDNVSGWSAYVLGVPWALMQAGHQLGGFDAAIDSCVPLGSGLSSSAALECAIAAALADSFGLRLPAGDTDATAAAGGPLLGSDAGRAHLAAACVRAENEMAGAPTGGMDQAASLRCEQGSAILLDCESASVRHVPFDCREEELELLVINTRAHHALVDGQYAERRASCERAARLLGVASLRHVTDLPAAIAELERAGGAEAGRLIKRVRHVVSEIARTAEAVALLDAGRIAAIGPLLNDSHASLRDDYQVSCPELDCAVDAAREAGALGARMTGGGFGGSAIALVPAAIAREVAQAVTDAFAANSFTAPEFLPSPPSAPAGRTA